MSALLDAIYSPALNGWDVLTALGGIALVATILRGDDGRPEQDDEPSRDSIGRPLR